MSAGAEMDGVPVEADQFGEAQARLNRDQQQGVVAAAEPRRPIGRAEDCLDFGAGQEANLPLVVALARDREHTLDEGAVSGLLEGHEAEEGTDGGQTQVTRLTPAPRFVSRSARNAPMNGASRSSRVSSDGGLRSRACANVNNSRNVSL